MRLKDGLILREVAGQYIIVPTGKRVQEIKNMVYISSSGAYLWDFMKENEFTEEMLVKKIMEHYIGVTEEIASRDIEKFLSVLKKNHILEGAFEEESEEEMSGEVIVEVEGSLEDR